MVIELPYKSLKHTLKSLKVQVEDSMPYIKDYIPSDIETPEQLFYFLRGITTYQKDPRNIELLQTVQTLMNRGGKGDCDCFTILVLASCEYLGFEPQQVALVGRTNRVPSHIYSLVWDEDKKKICSMDLTNPYYDTERPYPFKQTLDFMMTLRLEDDGLSGRKERKARRAAKREVRQQKKTAKKVGRQQVKLKRAESKTNRKMRRIEGRDAKKEAKVVRREKKAERKVNRATSRTDRAQDRQAVRAQRVANRMVRAEGRGAIIEARQAGRLDKVENKFATPEGSEAEGQEEYNEQEAQESQQESYEPSYDPSMDTYNVDTPGSEYMSPDFEQETEEAEYEVMPGEEEQYEEPENIDQYEEYPMEDLSFMPFITGIIQGGKKLLQKVSNSQAGQAVQKGASIYNELQTLRSENTLLKQEIENEKSKKYYFGGGGVVLGAGIGFLAGRKFK